LHQELRQLADQLGLTFHELTLYQEAFTHSSYVNENRPTVRQDNERLEFLGDAVLELAVSEFLFKKFRAYSEGEMTKLRAAIVCEPSLVKYAEKLQFGAFIMLGKGEEMTGGRTRPALLADVFESFVGALYLDQGLGAVQTFLERHVFPLIDEAEKLRTTDYKSRLQEFTQHHGLGSIEYRIADERGPAHDREFIAEVYIDDKLFGTGFGRSKKESEQQAAAEALGKLNVEL